MRKFIIILTFAIAGCNSVKKENSLNDKVIIGYIYAEDRVLNGRDINAELFTHINFAFANIADGLITEGFKADSANYAVLNSLKERNSKLKILVSVGGWSWSDGFSDMAATKESRRKFIKSAILFIEKYNIDGIDLDWEYPGLPGEGNPFKPEDKHNFTLLLQEFRVALDELGEKNDKHFMLTIAAGAQADYLKNVEPDKIFPVLDYINLMTYDFVGGWDSITGHHTNLYTPKLDSNASSCKKSVGLFIHAGVPSEKLVLGIAFYGKGWKDVSAKNNGLIQLGKGYGPGYSYKSIKESYLNKRGFVRYFDSSARAPYIYNADSLIMITYEDPESVKFKCEFIKEQKLGGAMFWEYSSDSSDELITAINKGLK